MGLFQSGSGYSEVCIPGDILIRGGVVVHKILIAVFVFSLILSAAAQSGPTVLAAGDLKKIVPEAYFFRGMSATTQLRN